MTALVSLVGAGPGDPELITLKAVDRLRRAEVVLTDALANPALLEHCSPDARVLDVGKRAGGRHTPQEVIEAVLIEQAQAGHRVVRLKGGDPFVFGRGGEEALALARHGVPFEVIPGISSALAVPASAHIPVTHRGLARHVTVITGTAARDGELLEDQWAALARAGGTLVFLMALRPLARITERLRQAGLPGATPAAMVHGGTLPGSRAVEGNLDDIAERVRLAGLGSPALLVVGEVLDVRREVLAHTTAPSLPFAPEAFVT